MSLGLSAGIVGAAAGAGVFVLGANGEFVAIDPNVGASIIFGIDPAVLTISDLGVGGNDFTQATVPDQADLITDDTDYNTTDSLDFDDVNTYHESVLANSAWTFMHDNSTPYVLHVLVQPGIGSQTILSNQANTTNDVGFTLMKVNATIQFSTSNGSAKIQNASAPCLNDGTTAQLYQIIVDPTDVGNEVRITVDDGTEDVTAIGGGVPAETDSIRAGTLGSSGGGASPMLGTIAHVTIQPNHTAQYISNVRDLLAATKGATV